MSLPKEIREATYQKIELLLENSSHPSLRVKKIKGTRDSNGIIAPRPSTLPHPQLSLGIHDVAVDAEKGGSGFVAERVRDARGPLELAQKL